MDIVFLYVLVKYIPMTWCVAFFLQIFNIPVYTGVYTPSLYTHTCTFIHVHVHTDSKPTCILKLKIIEVTCVLHMYMHILLKKNPG